MRFAQEIRVRCDDADGLVELLADWDRSQAASDVMGYIGTRLLADRDSPGHYTILSEFAEVDGELTAADEAEENNKREETDRWAANLRALVEGEPDWIHYDELYRTGITGNLRTR
jgi:hypothetical protein